MQGVKLKSRLGWRNARPCGRVSDGDFEIVSLIYVEGQTAGQSRSPTASPSKSSTADTVLRAVADVLKGSFRDEDVPCRFGGEEFVVLLPGATAEVAAQKAEELRAKVEGLIVRYVDGNLPKITISTGVAAFPDCGDNPPAVLKAADDALYRAKDAGRNRVELSSGALAKSAMASGPAAAGQHALLVGLATPGQETASQAKAA